MTLLIHGKHSYRANVSESAAGTIASLEHALGGIEDRMRERETDLSQSRRQAADFSKQLDQPFEHEEKLGIASTRQQQIISSPLRNVSPRKRRDSWSFLRALR